MIHPVVDIGRWIQFQLGGAPIGMPGIVDSALATTHTPQVVLGTMYQAVFRAPSLPVTYGYGWVIYNYRGRVILEHAGAWAGYTSFIVLIPDEGLGFAILANLRLKEALDDIRQMRVAMVEALVKR